MQTITKSQLFQEKLKNFRKFLGELEKKYKVENSQKYLQIFDHLCSDPSAVACALREYLAKTNMNPNDALEDLIKKAKVTLTAADRQRLFQYLNLFCDILL